MPLKWTPSSQAELVRLSLTVKPAPRPAPQPVNRDHWSR